MRKQVFRRIWSGVLIIVLLFGLSSGMNVRAEEKVGKCDVTLLMNHYITYVKIDDQLVAKVQEYLSCDEIKYGIYGIEEPQNTEKHMHIYINFRKRTYKSTIKKNLK